MTEQKTKDENIVFDELITIFKKLRDKESGCPWDLTQDHKTLKPYLLEETYETFEAIDNNDFDELCKELGDILLQVLLHAQIASEDKKFTIHDVLNQLKNKMIRRHPHVFGSDAENKKRPSIKEIKENWDLIKKEEKKHQKKSQAQNSQEKLKKIMHKHHPSTLQALELGFLAKENNFDWLQEKDVLAQLICEVEELKEAWNEQSTNRKKNIEDEISDIYFTLAQLCRHLNLNPELVAYQGNQKFSKRYEAMHNLAKAKTIDFALTNPQEKEKLWAEVKTKKLP